MISHMNALSRDDTNREQFIDGSFDSDIYELLLREDPQTFDEAVNRAMSLEAITKGSRYRQRKRISAKRTMAEADRGEFWKNSEVWAQERFLHEREKVFCLV